MMPVELVQRLYPGIPTRYNTGGSMRMLLWTSCDSACKCCNEEGHMHKPDLQGIDSLHVWQTKQGGAPVLSLADRLTHHATMEDVDAAIDIAKMAGYSDIHFSGGEPSLDADFLIGAIGRAKAAKLTAGMTTHGEYARSKFASILNAGLSNLTISFHVNTPQDYREFDRDLSRPDADPKQALSFAGLRLGMKRQNILYAQELAGTRRDFSGPRVNIMVREGGEEAEKNVLEWCFAHDIYVRLQANHLDLNRSWSQMDKLLDDLGARAVEHVVAVGDSAAAAVIFETQEKRRFTVKYYGEQYLEPMCGDCPLAGTDNCHELWYGPRVERGKNPVSGQERGQVRLCMDRYEEGKTVFWVPEFISLAQVKGSIPYEAVSNHHQAVVRVKDSRRG